MTQKGNITILFLYPNEMNIYGDWGNVLTLQRRLEWHGYQPQIVHHHPGKKFIDTKKIDIVVGGGGQDSGQLLVENDLQTIGQQLHDLADKNVPMLMVCGLYQLFGKFFKTYDGKTLQGISLFDAETYGSDKRLIGNTIVNTPFGEIIGYENHSGLTTLGPKQAAFGQVVKGGGNNGEDKTEGARYKNVYGTYLHGSLLPKNPIFADYLLEKAIENRYGEFKPSVIDDVFAQKARAVTTRRPR